VRVFSGASAAAVASLVLTACAGAGSTAPATGAVCNVPASIYPSLSSPAPNATGVQTSGLAITIVPGMPGEKLRLTDAAGTVLPGGGFTPSATPPFFFADAPQLAAHTTYTVHVIETGLPVQSAQIPCGFPGGVNDAVAGSFTTQ
jgi:hypothetical protein